MISKSSPQLWARGVAKGNVSLGLQGGREDKTVNMCDLICDFCLYICFCDLSVQSTVSMTATCFLSAVNIYALYIYLLLGDRLLLIVFLSEVGNFCYCILEVRRRNVPSLAWIQIVCFQLNSDRKSVTCRGEKKHMWGKHGGHKKLLKAREQQCSSKNELGKKGILRESSVKWKPSGITEQVSIKD